MKKILILLVLALMVTAFLAADVTAFWIWSDTQTFPGKAGVPVSLDTTGTFQAEIGFTTTGANNNEANQSIGKELTAVENTGIFLKVDKATGKAYYNDGTVDTNDIFATWLIKSGENLKVFLYADGPLKSGDKEIGWKLYDRTKNKVYVNCLPLEDEVGVSSGETVTTPPTEDLYLYEHKPDEKIKNYGSVELTVETESVWDKSAGEYKANLYMVIVSEGEGGTTT